jgi:hypothetical protein
LDYGGLVVHVQTCSVFSVAAAIFLAPASNTRAWSQEGDHPIAEIVLSDDIGAQQGTWRTKVQHVFDARSRQLLARQYAAFDPAPSRDLDFLWIPDDLATDHDGPISGHGELVWRMKALPAYDPSAIYSTYIGDLRRGRPHGRGRYVNRDGLAYDGEWKHGRFEGNGILQLPNGEEYQGGFVRGRAAGPGRYTDMTGEIFTGKFAAGMRQGDGKTRLPGGATYQSRWDKGVEVAGSVRIRIAQLGNQPSGAASTDPIRLGVTVQKKPIPQEMQQGELLGYAARVSQDRLLVEPDDPQLVAVWKNNGTIEAQIKALKSGDSDSSMYRQSLFGFDKKIIYPALFSFDLQNKTPTPVEITGFYLDVRKSQSDNQPALDLSEGNERGECSADAERGNFAPYFTLRNYGWSPVEHATLRFTFRPVVEGVEEKSLEFSTDIGRFERTTKVDVSEAITGAGGKLDLLKRFGKTGYKCKLDSKDGGKADNPAQCIASMKATGAFGRLLDIAELRGIDLVVGLRGKLGYKYKNSKGEIQSGESPLRADLDLAGLLQQPECGEGGPPQVLRKDPITLKLDQENYRILLPLRAKRLEPGQSQQFTQAINATQASRHDFQIVAKLSDGREIRSRSIDLLYFTPKWNPTPLYVR